MIRYLPPSRTSSCKVGDGESGGTPPLRELVGFDAGREHTLGRRGESLLQMQRPPPCLLGHQTTRSMRRSSVACRPDATCTDTIAPPPKKETERACPMKDNPPRPSRFRATPKRGIPQVARQNPAADFYPATTAIQFRSHPRRSPADVPRRHQPEGSRRCQGLERGNVGSQAALIELVDPRPDESVLDVGTGSGGLALLAARRGAEVTGIDIAEDGIERAARARAKDEGLNIRFDVGDAQSLPYADAAFDVVVSTFGVIFASDQRKAAGELARVCRAGGRLGLTLMPTDSRSAGAVSIIREFGDDQGGDHPAAFADRLAELLGGTFDFEARRRDVPAEPGATTWDEAVDQLGELRNARVDPTA